MNAAVLTEYGKIEWQSVPVPEINDNQVLIKVGAVGICGSDLHIYNGDFAPRTQTPMIQGHEFAGTIVNIGKNIKNYKIGDRAAVDPIIPCGKCAACKLGHYPACTNLKLLGVDMNGGFGEYVAADEHMLYRLYPEISDKQGALVELYSIGFHACNRAGLQENDTAVIWGSGRVGQAI
ncbi:MAG: alcohol dehydrogenase catalytic domain-containing protein, partial [Calditrichaeota bacterium]|nr:alcohol dehydrogenase catalytic domain-containing protein [Calditrichota bacterium]